MSGLPGSGGPSRSSWAGALLCAPARQAKGCRRSPRRTARTLFEVCDRLPGSVHQALTRTLLPSPELPCTRRTPHPRPVHRAGRVRGRADCRVKGQCRCMRGEPSQAAPRSAPPSPPAPSSPGASAWEASAAGRASSDGSGPAILARYPVVIFCVGQSWAQRPPLISQGRSPTARLSGVGSTAGRLPRQAPIPRDRRQPPLASRGAMKTRQIA
jgi:hypothetical protein